MLTFATSLEDSVKEDIATLRKSPFIKRGTQLVGLVYNVETGEVTMVE
jgi:carbonic anhydrase